MRVQFSEGIRKTLLRNRHLPEQERPVLAALIGIVVLGGTNIVAVKFSNLELAPFWGAGLRFLASALLFFLIVVLRRIEFPRGRALTGVLIYGVLSFGVSFAFSYYALVSVNAGLASVVLSLVPIATLFLASAHRQERLDKRGLAGGLVAIAGTAVVFSGQLVLLIPLAPLLALLGATISTAEAAVVLKHFPKANTHATNALAMLVGSAILLVLSAVAHESWTLPVRTTTLVSIAYLIVPGTVFLFVLYLYVISRWSASATNYAFVLLPLMTVLIASLLAGESVTFGFLVGAALVLGGVYFGAISRVQTEE